VRIEREEIIAAYDKGPRAVVKLVNRIVQQFEKTIARLRGDIAKLEDTIELLGIDMGAQERRIDFLVKENQELAERIAELEARLNMNSRNSSKPPSSDGLSKPPAKRRKAGKPPGGQQGHVGHTHRMVERPDHTVVHTVSRCASCGRSLDRVKAAGYERRQVFELPVVRVEVTEHGAQRKKCPSCGSLNTAAFPQGVTQSAQYGPRARSAAVYLNQYQLLPYERASELMADLFGCSISQATLVNATRAASENLTGVEREIQRLLTSSPVACFDETGMRVEGRGAWLHVASTDKLTHYAVHPKRGREATDDIGILPAFTGTAVHDCWSPYLTYDCSHALCCAHLVRELAFQEECGQEWASDMIDLLLKAYAAVNEAKAMGRQSLKRSRLKTFEKRYERILARGFTANPLPEARGQPVRRGRKKKTKARNLLERLRDHRCEVLAFMNDFSVPFDNNLAERDLRMSKVKQKISGTFRSWNGAHDFCRIRTYISTAKKNHVPVVEALASAFRGEPLVPGSIQP
jgi:transposase/uncharacterized coiled-coil protein SlyX